ncbi:MAG: hypothetical protein KBI14_22400 [Kofleriaceae bacterium]|nr:hypothetical protein [Kofleriaceae bacterium]MBP9858879.1 hypothetical protein [Kofleriaceae bacterium]
MDIEHEEDLTTGALLADHRQAQSRQRTQLLARHHDGDVMIDSHLSQLDGAGSSEWL